MVCKGIVTEVGPPEHGLLRLGVTLEFETLEDQAAFFRRYVAGEEPGLPRYMRLTVKDGEQFSGRRILRAVKDRTNVFRYTDDL